MECLVGLVGIFGFILVSLFLNTCAFLLTTKLREGVAGKTSHIGPEDGLSRKRRVHACLDFLHLDYANLNYYFFRLYAFGLSPLALQWGQTIAVWNRVAEVARGHRGPPPKSLDSDENFKSQHTLFCRKLRFVAIYALFGDLWAKKCLFWVKNSVSWARVA